jgi:uncharacterized protein YdeI (YjbR/CyaY-like superfamily)
MARSAAPPADAGADAPATPTAPAASAPHRFRDAHAWEAWLHTHHARSDGTWLQLAKAGAAEPGLTYAQALEVALCFGWIDGQKKGLDAHAWLQRFTPRRERSLWSKINRSKAEALIASGRMHPAGLAEVERARADGRWDEAYDGARAAIVPPELQAAFDASPLAAAFFATLDGANRYAVLWRVQTAKRPETRAKRIATLVDMLARGEKIHSR